MADRWCTPCQARDVTDVRSPPRDRYNAGSKNIDEFFAELRRLADDLNDDQERHIREQLSEEELAVFDILTKPDPVLSAADEAKVKKVARDLLTRLKRELLVLDWRNRQVTRAAVQVDDRTWVTL